MNQQVHEAYIFKVNGMYMFASNGGPAIRLHPCDCLSSLAGYIKNYHNPIHVNNSLPPSDYINMAGADACPLSGYELYIVESKINLPERFEAPKLEKSDGILSRLTGAIPALSAILGFK